MFSKRLKNIFLTLLISAGAILFTSAGAHAIPALQLYIEGSTYDVDTDTWVINSDNFIIWVIGDIESYGTILDVTLAAAYDSDELAAGGTVSIAPTSISTGYFPQDPSASPTPVSWMTGEDDSPIMGSGDPLPSHGVYGEGTSWETWRTGDPDAEDGSEGSDDFYLTDSEIGDFTTGECPDDPSCEYPSWGQINAYEVSISGFTWVHFDAFNHIELNKSHTKFVFAPFSHDAEAVPEPSTILLLGFGMLGLWGLKRRFGFGSDREMKKN